METHIILYRSGNDPRLYPFLVEAENPDEALETFVASAAPGSMSPLVPVAISTGARHCFREVLPVSGWKSGSVFNEVELTFTE
jgi:hypothetical protein